MTIKKTVTDKVRAANQDNGKKSRGPIDANAVNQNARKHGLLSKHLMFEKNEKTEYEALLNELAEEYEPVGRTDWELVNEVAVCLWKSAEGNGWEMQALAHRRKAAAAILRTVVENCDGEQLPLFTQRDGADSAAQLGWDCQELVVRAGTRISEQEEGSSGDCKGKSGNVQIEARLSTTVDTLLRYQAATKRDFYRAISELRSRRGERRRKSD